MIQMTLDKRKMIVHNGIPHDRQEDDIDMLVSTDSCYLFPIKIESITVTLAKVLENTEVS